MSLSNHPNVLGGGIPLNTLDAVTSLTGTANQVTVSGSTGDVTVSLPATISVTGTTPSVSTATGQTNTGFFQVNGKTSGATKITTADATAQTVTISTAAQTVGAATLTVPDMGGASDTFSFIGKAETLTGSKTLSAAAGNPIHGTNTNDNAAAGYIGEFIDSTVASPGVSLVNSTAKTVASISLTAGDWDVYGSVTFTQGATTTESFARASISTTDNTHASVGLTANWMQGTTTLTSSGIDGVSPLVRTRISVSTTTVVYLVASCNFITSTMQAYGEISARRAR